MSTPKPSPFLQITNYLNTANALYHAISVLQTAQGHACFLEDELKTSNTIVDISCQLKDLIEQIVPLRLAEGGGQPATSPAFEFALGQPAKIKVSREVGIVISRAERLACENQYLLRYQDSSGKAVEHWWGAEALTKLSSLTESNSAETT
jgi:hypothetical protein